MNKGNKPNKNSNFSSSIAGAVFIFMILTALYLVISDTSKTSTEVPISDLAKSVSLGEVKSIVVEGEKLDIIYQNDEVAISKKEAGSSLSQTLANYGVKPEALANTKIEVKRESGFMYWFLNIMPFLVPVLFILFFFVHSLLLVWFYLLPT